MKDKTILAIIAILGFTALSITLVILDKTDVLLEIIIFLLITALLKFMGDIIKEDIKN